MLELIRSDQRGQADHGWLKSQHSFSFADYYDPRRMGFGVLRVINEDRVAPGMGFGKHSHRDMEIISYVLDGELAHEDNMGNGSVMVPGDVQLMSAGTGVTHSEFNHAKDRQTHFLQIWLMPAKQGIKPGYEQTHFPAEDKRGRLRLIAAPDGLDGAVTLHSDASLHAGLFDGAESATLRLAPGRLAYVHLVRGRLNVNGQALQGGDALQVRGEEALHFNAGEDAEVLVFDLAS